MATQPTLARINKALADKGIRAELVKGEGYYYAWGLDVESCQEQGIYGVCYLNQLTIEQWVREVERKVEGSRNAN